jgi:hypothetical protein
MTLYAMSDERTICIQVECYAGYRGEETPRHVRIGDSRMEVLEILDRWLAPQHRYFKYSTADGCQWIIRHDTPTGKWELTHFKQGNATGPGREGAPLRP